MFLTNDNLQVGLKVRLIWSTHPYRGMTAVISSITSTDLGYFGKTFYIKWNDDIQDGTYWSINDGRGNFCFEIIEQESEQPTKVCNKCGCCNKPESKNCWYCHAAN